MRIMVAAAIMAAAIPFAYAQDQAGGAIKVAAEGGVLTDSQSMTLYTFDKDEPGTSNCYDTCATNWPPLTADENAQPEGDFTLVERTDGTKQWAYKGEPRSEERRVGKECRVLRSPASQNRTEDNSERTV